jgi:hypothetical protein
VLAGLATLLPASSMGGWATSRHSQTAVPDFGRWSDSPEQPPSTDDPIWIKLESLPSVDLYVSLKVDGETIYLTSPYNCIHRRSRRTGALIDSFQLMPGPTPASVCRFGDSILVVRTVWPHSDSDYCEVYRLNGLYERRFWPSQLLQPIGAEWDGDKFWFMGYDSVNPIFYTMTRTGTVLKTLHKREGTSIEWNDFTLDRMVPNRLWTWLRHYVTPFYAAYVSFESTLTNTYEVRDSFQFHLRGRPFGAGFHFEPGVGGCVYLNSPYDRWIWRYKVHETPPLLNYKVMIAHCEPDTVRVAQLARALRDSSNGDFTTVDHYSLSANAAFPATDWFNSGYRVVMVSTNAPANNPAAAGDSLARFIDLGGGVVELPFANTPSWEIAGRFRSQYAPTTLQPSYSGTGAMTVVHNFGHPVMAGVYGLAYSLPTCAGSTHNNLRGPNSTCLAEFNNGYVTAACFDSLGRHAVSIGFSPFAHYSGYPNSGWWIRLLVNAIRWSHQGDRVLVAACYPTGSNEFKRLADTLFLYRTHFGSYDTINARYRMPPSADSLWANGFRAILTYSNVRYYDTTAWGNMLADFVEKGGGVVVMPFSDYADNPPCMPGGRWKSRYMLWEPNSGWFGPAVLGTVYAPGHPVMYGVGQVGTSRIRSAALTPKASAYVTRIADWDSGNLECVAYDSMDRHVVYLGFFPGTPFQMTGDSLFGQWIAHINNALEWSVEGSGSPPTGINESWTIGPPDLARPELRATPNPSAGSATIAYSLPRAGNMSLKLYDVTGQLVTTLGSGYHRAGASSLRLSPSSLSSGIYLLRLATENTTLTRKLVVE